MRVLKCLILVALIALICVPAGIVDFSPLAHSHYASQHLSTSPLTTILVRAQEDDDDVGTVQQNLKGAKIPSKTDDEVVNR